MQLLISLSAVTAPAKLIGFYKFGKTRAECTIGQTKLVEGDIINVTPMGDLKTNKRKVIITPVSGKAGKMLSATQEQLDKILKYSTKIRAPKANVPPAAPAPETAPKTTLKWKLSEDGKSASISSVKVYEEISGVTKKVTGVLLKYSTDTKLVTLSAKSPASLQKALLIADKLSAISRSISVTSTKSSNPILGSYTREVLIKSNLTSAEHESAVKAAVRACNNIHRLSKIKAKFVDGKFYLTHMPYKFEVVKKRIIDAYRASALKSISI